LRRNWKKKLSDTALCAPDTVILAADEASLYLQASLMRVWAPVGQTPVIKVAANRDNTHFYGALNLVTGTQVVLRTALMNAQTSLLFLCCLLQAYPDKHLLLFWDRATWHKGEALRSFLEANPRLEIMWFPPGCPELNPQEHVWKAAREAVSHNHQCAKMDELADAFESHLTQTQFPCSLLDKHGYHEICAMSK
jgi:transposase